MTCQIEIINKNKFGILVLDSNNKNLKKYIVFFL